MRQGLLDAAAALAGEVSVDQARAALGRLRPTDPASLPTGAGVYLISNDRRLGGNGADSYVGCAKALHARFWREDFGHLVANSTRSQLVIGRPPFFVFVLEEVTEPGLMAEMLNPRIARLEVSWFVLLAGLGLSMVNSVGNLGRTSDGETQHIVAWDMDADHYRLLPSQQDTARLLGIAQGALSKVVRAEQNQTNGHVFRPATADEIAAGPDGFDAFVRARPPDVAWRSGQGYRNRLLWGDGPLRAEDAARLQKRRRKGQYDTSKRSGFVGVSRTSGRPGCWRALYIPDPARRNNTRALGYAFPSPESAASAREAHLDAHPELRGWNKSNAARLRAAGQR